MKAFFEHISDTALKCRIVIRDETGKIDLQIIYANKQAEELMNKSTDEMIGCYMTEVFPGFCNTIFDWPKIISEAAMTNESKIIEQYFEAFEKYLRLNIFGYKDGCFDILISDLTEKREIKRRLMERDRQIEHLESELKERANVEILTKLYNFQFIVESINNSIESYKEDGINFCILLIDIDDFKNINLSYGIKAGDSVLQNIAYSLGVVARKIDIAGRYGNDKFILIINNLDFDIAKIMVEKLKQHINRNCVRLNNTVVSVSGALLEYNGESVAELFDKAEQKIVKAKAIGKGTIIS